LSPSKTACTIDTKVSAPANKQIKAIGSIILQLPDDDNAISSIGIKENGVVI